MRNGGSLISISGDTLASERDTRAETVTFVADVRAELQKLFNDAASGAVGAEIARVYRFGEALDALARVQSRHTRGKLVISI